MFAVLPLLTAALAIGCALWPPARRFVWIALALAVLNVVLTPLTSGEWFYQRVEESAYRQAVVSGKFTDFDGMLAGHDPTRLRRMLVLSGGLLASLLVLAVLHVRSKSASAVTSVFVVGVVLLPAVATLVQVYLLLTRTGAQSF